MTIRQQNITKFADAFNFLTILQSGLFSNSLDNQFELLQAVLVPVVDAEDLLRQLLEIGQICIPPSTGWFSPL